MDFMIVTTGRSGSEYLVQLLDSHPAIRCWSEIFHPTADEAGRYAASPKVGPVNHLRSLRRSEGAEGVVGFKLTANCLRGMPGLAELSPRLARRLIVVRRDNRLAQHLSARLAEASGTFHSIYGGDYTGVEVPLHAGSLAEALADIDRRLDELLEPLTGMPRVHLVYRGDFEAAELERAQRFLGVDPAPLQAENRRLRRRPMREMVANWEEVEAALSGTPFAGDLKGEALGA